MEEVETVVAGGYSHLFPAVPILAVISTTCCLLILRSFIKTHVFAIFWYLYWIALGNVLLLINTCIWRGNVRNIPVYSDIVSRIWQIYALEIYLSILCLNKFIWTISRPAPSVKVYDTRRRINRIDAAIVFGIPLVMSPLFFFISGGRYLIIEDFGPWPFVTTSIETFLVMMVPTFVAGVISITFSCLSCYNFWRARRLHLMLDETSNFQQSRILSRSQAYKYTCVSIYSVISVLFGLVWILLPWFEDIPHGYRNLPWYSIMSLQHNLHGYKEVYFRSRNRVDQLSAPVRRNLVGFAFTLPLAGFQIFLCFGLGHESRKIYVDWLKCFMRYLQGSRLYGLIKRLVTKVVRWRRSQADPNNFTPFLVHDILLEDLWSPIKGNGLSKADPHAFPTFPPPSYTTLSPHDAYAAPLSPLKVINRNSRFNQHQESTAPTAPVHSSKLPSPISPSHHKKPCIHLPQQLSSGPSRPGAAVLQLKPHDRNVH
ncbi:a-factor receptor [Serendipita sp. 411]|nr:a-factor receptor [Serendipita sp. 411]